MTASRERRGPAADGPLAGSSLRGAALIAAAVVVGVILLGKGFESGILPSTAPDTTLAPQDTTGGTTPDGSTVAPTTPVTHAVAEVRVAVLNGGAPPELERPAGTANDALTTLGYTALGAFDTADVAATVVYFAEGFEADAAAIAAALGITAVPQAMPAPPPAEAPAEANVIVVLGPDFTPAA